MLVLERRLGQRVLISDNVSITVLSIKNNQIELGIDTPSTMLIGPEEKFSCITRLLLKNFSKKVA